MLALVVLVSAVSIGWAIHQPEKVAPEEESGSSEVVLQSFSTSDIETYGSYFTEFSSISSVKLVNINQSTAALKVEGILSSTSSFGSLHKNLSDCGDCYKDEANVHHNGYYAPNGDCWLCTTTPYNWTMSSFTLGDWIGML